MRVASGMHMGDMARCMDGCSGSWATSGSPSQDAAMLPSLLFTTINIQCVSQQAPSGPTPRGTTPALGGGGGRCSDKPGIRRCTRECHPSRYHEVSVPTCFMLPASHWPPSNSTTVEPQARHQPGTPPSGKRSRSREPCAARPQPAADWPVLNWWCGVVVAFGCRRVPVVGVARVCEVWFQR